MLDNNRILKIIITILMLLLAVSSLMYYEQIRIQNNNIKELKDISEKQKETIILLEENITNLEQELTISRNLLINETQTRQKLERDIIKLTMVARIDYGVLAVDENDKGHLIPLEIIIKSGKSELFLNVANVLFDETLQSSAQTAVRVAREITRTSLADKDIMINIRSPAEAQGLVIQGGSAGAAMTLAAMAAMQGKKLRSDVLITGTIREDHTIGRIGAPRAKALAAKENGAVIFLVPAGQKSEVGDVGIDVREVATIEDAARYALL